MSDIPGINEDYPKRTRLMRIRVYVQADHKSESLRYVATAMLDGKHLHKVKKYGHTAVVLGGTGSWQTRKG